MGEYLGSSLRALLLKKIVAHKHCTLAWLIEDPNFATWVLGKSVWIINKVIELWNVIFLQKSITSDSKAASDCDTSAHYQTYLVSVL
jgi:hypothetical protein